MNEIASIQGKIVEYYTRRSVPGAVVIVNDRSTVTDQAGRFSMDVPMGTLTIKVTHRQFYDYITSLNITASIAYDIGTITLQSKVRAL